MTTRRIRLDKREREWLTFHSLRSSRLRRFFRAFGASFAFLSRFARPKGEKCFKRAENRTETPATQARHFINKQQDLFLKKTVVLRRWVSKDKDLSTELIR